MASTSEVVADELCVKTASISSIKIIAFSGATLNKCSNLLKRGQVTGAEREGGKDWESK
jgi:hypothetical protein